MKIVYCLVFFIYFFQTAPAQITDTVQNKFIFKSLYNYGALFCVAKAYDTTKEYFAVSYLSHEAQHFSDQKNYSNIPSWHLEYRAKLTELSK